MDQKDHEKRKKGNLLLAKIKGTTEVAVAVVSHKEEKGVSSKKDVAMVMPKGSPTATFAWSARLAITNLSMIFFIPAM